MAVFAVIPTCKSGLEWCKACEISKDSACHLCQPLLVSNQFGVLFEKLKAALIRSALRATLCQGFLSGLHTN